jgi:hypothetical protein
VTVQRIRDAIRSGEEATVRILNYKRGGAPFWNMFTLAPMKDSSGTTRFLVGVQASGARALLHCCGIACSVKQVVHSVVQAYNVHVFACYARSVCLLLLSSLMLLLCMCTYTCVIFCFCSRTHPHASINICAQVDVTAQGSAADGKAPAWTKSPSDEALKVEEGNQAATLISSALQSMGWGASPWAQISGSVMRRRPHKGSDPAYQALLTLQETSGPLRLHHFRRVKQLGAGDVGLVDLVQLQVRCACCATTTVQRQ